VQYPIIVRKAEKFVSAILPNGWALSPVRVPYSDSNRDGATNGHHYKYAIRDRAGNNLGISEESGSFAAISELIIRIATDCSRDVQGI